MTALACLLAFGLGSALATLRMLNRRPLNYVIALDIAFHRNVPMLVHILLWYFGVAALLPMALNDTINQWGGEFLFPMIAIGLVTAAYVAEDLPSAIRAIPDGQLEASRSVGLSFLASMRKAILPQHSTTAIPPITHTGTT